MSGTRKSRGTRNKGLEQGTDNIKAGSAGERTRTTRTGIFRDGVFTLQGGNRLLAGDIAGSCENTSGIGWQTVATGLDIMGNFLTLGSWTPDIIGHCRSSRFPVPISPAAE